MDRRTFLQWVAASSSGLALSSLGFASDKKHPDILYIVIEDMAADMGCYGNPIVKTPNMDALAARGVRFDNAFCQVPLCNPSRTSIGLGLRPATTGVYGNNDDWRELIPEGHKPFPEFFHDHGYETVIAGKVFHNQTAFKNQTEKSVEYEASLWDRTYHGAGSTKYRTPPRKPANPDLPEGLSPTEYTATSLEWGPTGLKPEESWDYRHAMEAAEVLKEDRDKPLLLAVGLHAPHYTLRAPDMFYDLYPPESIPLPDYPADDLDDVPGNFPMFNRADELRLSPDEKRDVIASYYACISYIDYCLGAIMEALDASGRADNTVIVFWGDHGMQMGEHGLWRKLTMFNEATRVPFFMVAPGVAKPNSVCTQPVEMIDVYPTLAELAGFDIPKNLDAVSMVPLLLDPKRPWKKAAFMQKSKDVISLVTDRYRYTEWGSPEHAELYDHKKDPREITNVINDPAYAEVAEKLRALMKGGWRAALPDGITPVT